MDIIKKIFTDVKLLPVVTLARSEDAVPVAEALQAGGINIIEITMRTEAALESIRKISKSVKGVSTRGERAISSDVPSESC